MEYKIDAADKILGRLAGEVAILLQGKNAASFNPKSLSANRVIIYHTDGVRTTGRKLLQKQYRSHSGYPGSLKEEALGHLLKRDSRKVLRHAISGMLPKNKLRPRMLKNLILLKGESA